MATVLLCYAALTGALLVLLGLVVAAQWTLARVARVVVAVGPPAPTVPTGATGG